MLIARSMGAARALLACALAALLLRDGGARAAEQPEFLRMPVMAHASSAMAEQPAAKVAGGPTRGSLACTKESYQGEPLCLEVPMPTPWSSSVDPEAPLPDYPRPQLRRQNWLSLNGIWGFRAAASNEGWEAEPQRRIVVPYPPEAPLSGVKDHDPQHSDFEYRRTFSIPAGWKGQSVLLHFDAVDHRATVILNGHRLGSHHGGYARFSFDVTDALRPDGDNELLVYVSDPTEAAAIPIGKQRRWPPRHSIWYTSTSGIWQTVWLEPVPKAHISRLELVPDIDNSRLSVTVHGSGAAAGSGVAVTISADGSRVASAEGTVGTAFHVAIDTPRLWSPDSPFLYDLDVQLQPKPSAASAGRKLAAGPGSVSLLARLGEQLRCLLSRWLGSCSSHEDKADRVAAYFGMRKSSVGRVRDGSLRPLLNNEFVFQSGMLDQGFWPDGVYTPASDEALLFDLNLTQFLGFNLLRKHVKVESDRWYYHADRKGILVWQDMPSMFYDEQRGISGEVKEAFKTELREIMQQHSNVPSIVTWVVFNEGWGQQNTVEVANFARSIDGSRIIDAASGWTDFPVGDLIDRHDYVGPSSPDPTESRAAVLGEFGGLGLRVEGHMFFPDDAFAYEMHDSGQQLEERFAGLAAGLQGLMEDPRLGLGASVYTEVSDVEGEINGWVSYDRQVLKVNPQALRKANRQLIEKSQRLSALRPANASAAGAVAVA